MIAILGLMAFLANGDNYAAVGTSINAMVIETSSLATIYISSAVILFLVSMVAALFISQVEVEKQPGSFKEN